MVLLTAVPVSGPLSMLTGVMVATGAAAGAAGHGADWARPRRWAARRHPAAARGGLGGTSSLVAAEHAVDVGAGGQAEACGQRKSQEQALFEPVLCWNSPHYALRCPAPLPDPPESGLRSLIHRTDSGDAKTQPRPAPVGGRTSASVLTSRAGGDKGSQCRFGRKSARFHRYLQRIWGRLRLSRHCRRRARVVLAFGEAPQ